MRDKKIEKLYTSANFALFHYRATKRLQKVDLMCAAESSGASYLIELLRLPSVNSESSSIEDHSAG